jgi:PAS domain S-box-containing protein
MCSRDRSLLQLASPIATRSCSHTLAMRLFRDVWTPMNVDGPVLDDGLVYWRARILDAAWVVLLLGGAVTVIPGLLRAAADRDLAYVGWVLGSVTLLGIVLRWRISPTRKAVVMVVLAYGAGAIQFWQSGAFSPGPIWLFGTPIMAAALLGFSAAVAALVVVAATLLVLGPAAIETLPVAARGVPALEIIADFMFLDAMLTLFVCVLLYGLTNTVERIRHVNAERSRLASAVDQAADVVVTFGGDGRIDYANAALARLVGRTGDLRGHTLPELGLAPRDDEGFAAITRALQRDGAWAGRLNGARGDGPWHAQASFSALRDTGDAPQYLAMIRDVSRELRLEAQLRQAQKLEAIGTLAAGIAHDFNNLLVPILGSAELLKAELPAAAAPQLGDIIESARRARGLVAQILAVGRGIEAQRSALNLHDVISRLDRMLSAAGPVNVVIDYRLPNVGAVLLSETEAGQIVLNLCTNAFHAMQPSGGTLIVALEEAAGDRVPEFQLMTGPLDAGRTYVRLTVTDTGVGMDERTLSRMFEPFYSTKAEGIGSGLGLAIVHGIVTAMGGAVAANSTPMRGTSISVFLPRVTEAADSATATPDTVPRGAGQFILVVDDEPAVRRVTARSLERLGYRVAEAASARDALALLDEQPCDLLITDHNMPDGTGLELGAHASRRHPGLRMLLSSGLTDADTQRNLEQAGFSGFLGKPFEYSELARAVHLALSAPRHGDHSSL